MSFSFIKHVGYQYSNGVKPVDFVDDLMQRILLMKNKDGS